MNTPHLWQVTTTHHSYVETAFNANFTEFTTSNKSTSYAIEPWVGSGEIVKHAHKHASSRHGTLTVTIHHVYPTGERHVILDRTINSVDHDEGRKLRADVDNALHRHVHHGNMVQTTTSTTTHVEVVHQSTIPLHIIEGYKRNYVVKPK
jgi:hypothetical protein